MNDPIFKAIADPLRRKIFHIALVANAISISAIAAEFDISRQAISKHVKILEDADLLKIQRVGRERMCKANPVALQVVHDWSSYYLNFWNNKFDNLENFLSNNKKF